MGGQVSGRTVVEGDKDKEAAGEEGSGSGAAASTAAAMPNIKRQLQAFARRFWLRANHVLVMLC